MNPKQKDKKQIILIFNELNDDEWIFLKIIKNDWS
jgi:hypothetical protein